jgi:hypothetical protein
MSSGAGRVEQAVRAQLGDRGTSISLGLVAYRLGWNQLELTRSQRSSILRAIHRVIEGHPGWQGRCSRRSHGREYSNVEFIFMPPKTGRRPNGKSWGRLEDGLTDAERSRLAAKSVMQRPVSRRQRAKDRAIRTAKEALEWFRQSLINGAESV